MSLILDALKRAERERHAEPSAALGDLPIQRAARAGSRLPWKLATFIVVLGVLAGVGLKLVRKGPHPATATVQTPAPKAAPPKPLLTSPVPAQTPLIASPPPGPSVIPGTEGVASLDELTQGEPEPQMTPPPPQPAPTSPPKSATPAPAQRTPPPQPEPAEPKVAAAPESAPPEEAPARVEQPAIGTPPRATQPPPREIPPALRQQAPLRTYREMSPEYRADFPELTVQVHVFEQMPSQRFVIVNNRRYHEGETLAEGPVLVEIVKEGLVLDFRGERLLFPIGR